MHKFLPNLFTQQTRLLLWEVEKEYRGRVPSEFRAPEDFLKHDNATTLTWVLCVSSTRGWKAWNSVRKRQHAWHSCRAGSIVTSNNIQGLVTRSVKVSSRASPSWSRFSRVSENPCSRVKADMPPVSHFDFSASMRARIDHGLTTRPCGSRFILHLTGWIPLLRSTFHRLVEWDEVALKLT